MPLLCLPGITECIEGFDHVRASAIANGFLLRNISTNFRMGRIHEPEQVRLPLCHASNRNLIGVTIRSGKHRYDLIRKRHWLILWLLENFLHALSPTKLLLRG